MRGRTGNDGGVVRRSVPYSLLLALLIAGCGGDNDVINPPPANRAPVFTSPATASVAENSTGTVYTATATDADGNSLTYSLSGGADRARFAITSGGGLSFVVPPDFEAPFDADRNNIYLIQISVSDGTVSTTLDLQVTVTDAGGEAFRVRRVATGLTQPLFVAGIPDNSGRVLVVERLGRVRILNPATGAVAATPFLDVSGSIATDGERGLLGLALAPNFATTGVFYIYATTTGGENEVRRYTTLPGNRDQADPASADVLIRIPHPGFSNHNGGWIGFSPGDDLLYVASGDGGGGGDPNNNAQNRNSLLGKMLRIDVRSDGFPGDPLRDYAIPADNPFATSGGAPEIFALGLRNPFRSSFDTATSALWIGDVGQNEIEEIDIIPAGTAGLNFGWNLREGSQPLNGGANSAAFTAPVAEYLHGSGPLQGRSITGGYVYRGPVIPLRGLYIFADFITPNIWSLPIASVNPGSTLSSSAFTRRNADFAPDAGSYTNIASFGTDQAGNLYIVDFDGEIFVIEAA